MKQVVLVLIFSCLGFASCKVSGPAHSSRNANQQYELAYPIYDGASGLRAEVSNSDSVLYIRMELKDRASIGKVTRFGFTVYIDGKARKKRQIGLKYPLPKKMTGKSRPKELNRTPLMNKKFELPQEYEWITPSEGKRFDLRNEKTPIKIQMKRSQEMGLFYEAAIPFSMAFEEGIPSDSIFSIGLVSGSLNMDMMQGNMGQGKGMGQSGGMRQGGGQGGMGGGRPGMGGMQGGKGGNRMGNVQKMMNPIDFWIKVKLNNSSDN